MKTIAELNAIIPAIVKQVDDCALSVEYGGYLLYEEDGWFIEIFIEVEGYEIDDPGDYMNPPFYDEYITSAYVCDIMAYHRDEEDELTQFSKTELNELWEALDKALAESL